jgi:hypothetical protein
MATTGKNKHPLATTARTSIPLCCLAVLAKYFSSGRRVREQPERVDLAVGGNILLGIKTWHVATSN